MVGLAHLMRHIAPVLSDVCRRRTSAWCIMCATPIPGSPTVYLYDSAARGHRAFRTGYMKWTANCSTRARDVLMACPCAGRLPQLRGRGRRARGEVYPAADSERTAGRNLCLKHRPARRFAGMQACFHVSISKIPRKHGLSISQIYSIGSRLPSMSVTHPASASTRFTLPVKVS